MKSVIKTSYYLCDSCCDSCFVIHPLKDDEHPYFCQRCDKQLVRHKWYKDAKSALHTSKYGGRVRRYFGRKRENIS